MKVLVADDDADLRDLIAFTLTQAGYLVIKAGDGPTALKRFEDESPDLIVLDINMPGLSGFQVCEAIRRRSRVPVMMLTVRGEEEDLVRALGLGADDYLNKPFSPRTLLARIKALLLDQSALRGVGNIYADESLWRAKIHPMRIAAKLSPNESRKLRKALREILHEAIALRGSSISDFLDVEGRPGEYQRRHRAYGREAKPCYRCKAPIRRAIVAGRSSYFCPKCQLAPESAKRAAKRRKRVTPRHRAAS